MIRIFCSWLVLLAVGEAHLQCYDAAVQVSPYAGSALLLAELCFSFWAIWAALEEADLLPEDLRRPHAR